MTFEESMETWRQVIQTLELALREIVEEGQTLGAAQLDEAKIRFGIRAYDVAAEALAKSHTLAGEEYS